MMDSGFSPTQVNMANVPFSDGISLYNGNLFSPLWILDTGAIDHICPSLSFFTFFTLIKHVVFNLPNGTKLVSYYSGSIHLTPSLILTNVLYLPSFHCNLISITKLTYSLGCKLLFSHDSYAIQDSTCSRMISSVRVGSGPYIL